MLLLSGYKAYRSLKLWMPSENGSNGRSALRPLMPGIRQALANGQCIRMGLVRGRICDSQFGALYGYRCAQVAHHDVERRNRYVMYAGSYNSNGSREQRSAPEFGSRATLAACCVKPRNVDQRFARQGSSQNFFALMTKRNRGEVRLVRTPLALAGNLALRPRLRIS